MIKIIIATTMIISIIIIRTIILTIMIIIRSDKVYLNYPKYRSMSPIEHLSTQ